MVPDIKFLYVFKGKKMDIWGGSRGYSLVEFVYVFCVKNSGALAVPEIDWERVEQFY